MSTVALLEPVLTADNKDSIIERVRGASRRDVEKVLSEYRPPVNLRDRMRYVQVPAPRPKDIDVALLDRQCARAIPEVWRDPIATEQKVFVEILADEEFLQLFEEVRGLVPAGDEKSFAEVMKAALKEYRDHHRPSARQARREAKKGAASPDSRRRELDDRSRHIPDEVRDEVFVRDRGQCTFVGADGTRCQSRKGLQIDHIVPFAAGGNSDSSNLRLLCGAHNRLMAERALGKHVMQPYWRRQ